MALKVMLLDRAFVNTLSLRPSQYVTSLVVSSCRINFPKQYSTEIREDEDTDSESTAEEELFRNISRLPKNLHRRLGHVMKPPEEGINREDDRWKFYSRARFNKYQRKLFAKYGYDSGVNPGIMWPSKEELSGIIEEERETEPTLQELWSQMKENREDREKRIMEKEKKIKENLAKMPALLEVYKKLQEQGQEKLAIQAKQKQLLEDARDYFGYKLFKNDPRLKELKQKKMEEERMARRQRSRAEKEKLHLERAQAKAADIRAKMEAKEAATKSEADDDDEEEKGKD